MTRRTRKTPKPEFRLSNGQTLAQWNARPKADDDWADEDTGRYSGGYRTYRDGSYREDFGSDR